MIHDSEEGGLGGMGGYLNFIFLFHGTNLAMGAGYAIEWEEEDIDINTDMYSKKNLNWRKWK